MSQDTRHIFSKTRIISAGTVVIFVIFLGILLPKVLQNHEQISPSMEFATTELESAATIEHLSTLIAVEQESTRLFKDGLVVRSPCLA